MLVAVITFGSINFHLSRVFSHLMEGCWQQRARAQGSAIRGKMWVREEGLSWVGLAENQREFREYLHATCFKDSRCNPLSKAKTKTAHKTTTAKITKTEQANEQTKRESYPILELVIGEEGG